MSEKKTKTETKRAKAHRERLERVAEYIRKIPSSARKIAGQFHVTRVAAYNFVAELKKLGIKVTSKDERQGKRGPMSRVFTCVKA